MGVKVLVLLDAFVWRQGWKTILSCFIYRILSVTVALLRTPQRMLDVRVIGLHRILHHVLMLYLFAVHSLILIHLALDVNSGRVSAILTWPIYFIRMVLNLEVVGLVLIDGKTVIRMVLLVHLHRIFKRSVHLQMAALSICHNHFT